MLAQKPQLKSFIIIINYDVRWNIFDKSWESNPGRLSFFTQEH